VSELPENDIWISRKNSFELIELFSINKVSLVKVSSCSNRRERGNLRTRESKRFIGPLRINGSLELIELPMQL
jgi:hypothetical protein